MGRDVSQVISELPLGGERSGRKCLFYCVVLSYEGTRTGFWHLVSEKIVANADDHKFMVVNGTFFFSDNVDASDLKQFFETNFSSNIFHLL